MDNDKEKQPLLAIADATLFEEVANRLKKLYKNQSGMEFLFGCFEFIFHEGRFQGIEDRPRYKRYRSPSRIGSLAT